MSHVEKSPGGCWLWQGALSDGYGTIHSGPHQQKKAHRVSWELHRGPIPKGLFVRHSCDIKRCVNPDHLLLGDHWDNMRDVVERKLQPHGEKHWCSKVTEQAVRSMRKEYDTGSTSIRKLAAKHGVGRMTVHAILHRQTWQHI